MESESEQISLPLVPTSCSFLQEIAINYEKLEKATRLHTYISHSELVEDVASILYPNGIKALILFDQDNTRTHKKPQVLKFCYSAEQTLVVSIGTHLKIVIEVI